MQGKEKCEGGATQGHVAIFPGPIQGNVNSMLKLSQLLALHNFHVTFINTEHIHNRLQRFGDIEALLATYPMLQFKSIPDGLPHHHPRSGPNQIEHLYHSLNLHSKPFLKDILVSLHPEKPRVTCFIADGLFGRLTLDVADEVGIPAIHYRAVSPCYIWALFCVPKLFESNELPIRGEKDMDRIITSIPGMENLIRSRDLPSACRGTESNLVDPLKYIVLETHQSLRARALILNTFEDLEGPVLSQIRLKTPKVFTIGPIHAHLNSKIACNTKTTPLMNSLSEVGVDRSCMTWLDSQPLQSVIYVSFGSIASITREQLLEFWYGLVKSNKRFLWVMRPDLVAGQEGDDKIPVELQEGTKERGFMVGWAPQEEVLAHKAVGGLLTHSGWNSTLESVVAGVPMICWPYFADQQINSRFVSEVWKLGLDMKDVCDRNIVEKMVNDLMEHRREEFLKSAQEMAALAHKSVNQGGSSYSSLNDLIQYIESTSLQNS